MEGEIKRLNRDIVGHLKRYRDMYLGHEKEIDALISFLGAIGAEEKKRAKGKAERHSTKKAVSQRGGNVVFLSDHPT